MRITGEGRNKGRGLDKNWLGDKNLQDLCLNSSREEDLGVMWRSTLAPRAPGGTIASSSPLPTQSHALMRTSRSYRKGPRSSCIYFWCATTIVCLLLLVLDDKGTEHLGFGLTEWVPSPPRTRTCSVRRQWPSSLTSAWMTALSWTRKPVRISSCFWLMKTPTSPAQVSFLLCLMGSLFVGGDVGGGRAYVYAWKWGRTSKDGDLLDMPTFCD